VRCRSTEAAAASTRVTAGAAGKSEKQRVSRLPKIPGLNFTGTVSILFFAVQLNGTVL